MTRVARHPRQPLAHVPHERWTRALTWPRRPLHGDAHTGNVLNTKAGPRWLDFEDVCSGPVEWDLASQTITPHIVDAYPGALEAARLGHCRSLRDLQILAGILTDDVQDASLYDEITMRLRLAITEHT